MCKYNNFIKYRKYFIEMQKYKRFYIDYKKLLYL